MIDPSGGFEPPDAADRVGYDPTTGTYHARHDPGRGDESLHAVVRAVAVAAAREPTEIAPLSSVVDPKALEAVLDAGGGDVRVSFTYEGCAVSVASDGEVVVQPDG